MCHDVDSAPPIPPLSGAAVSHDDLVLEAADGNRFAAFAAVAAIGWASYAALLGYIGGRAFEDNPLWGLLVGFGLAALTLLVVEVARRSRARSRRADVVNAVAEKSAQPDRRAA